MPVLHYLTHGTEMRQNFYGEKALAGLRAVGAVTLNPHNRPLTMQELIEAARGHQIIISDRHTPGEAALFDDAARPRRLLAPPPSTSATSIVTPRAATASW